LIDPAAMDALHPKALGARLLFWAPVWVPAVLCVQIGARGLLPELRRSRRIAAQESRMAERVERNEARRGRLEADLEKLGDPVYRERVRRSLEVAGSPPLTLDREYVGTLAPR